MKKIGLPDGSHDALAHGEYAQMFEILASSAQMNEQLATTYYGEQRGKPIAEVAPIVAYLNASRAAWQLIAAADVIGGEFDPAEFGKRCEAIARDMATRYRLVASEAKGRA